MNAVDQNQPPSPTLFKAQDKSSNQEVYFDDQKKAYEWMISHKNWVLKKQEVINWSFPLGQVVAEECWIKVG